MIIFWGDVVEDVRTVFEQINDTTIFIPTFAVEVNLQSFA